MGAHRPRVLATVPGIDGDNDVPLGMRLRLDGGSHRFGFPRVAFGDGFGLCPLRSNLLIANHRFDGIDGILDRADTGVIEIDHQPVAVLIIGRQREALGDDGAADIKHDAQPAALAHAGPHLRNGTVVQVELVGVEIQIGTVEVDDDTIGIVEGEDIGIDRSRHVEHQPDVVRSRPQPHVVHLDGLRLCGGPEAADRNQSGQPAAPKALAHDRPDAHDHSRQQECGMTQDGDKIP